MDTNKNWWPELHGTKRSKCPVIQMHVDKAYVTEYIFTDTRKPHGHLAVLIEV